MVLGMKNVCGRLNLIQTVREGTSMCSAALDEGENAMLVQEIKLPNQHLKRNVAKKLPQMLEQAKS